LASPIVAAGAAPDQRRAWVRRGAAGLGSIAILLALATRTDTVALVLFAVAGIVLVGVAIFGGERRRLVRFLVANLLLLVLLVWAATETSELVVLVEGNRVEAQLGGVVLVGNAGFSSTESVGVSIGPAEERPHVARWAFRAGSSLADLGLWLSTNLLSGVAGVTVAGPDGAPAVASAPTVWQSVRDGEPPGATVALEGWEPRLDRDGEVELTAANLNLTNYRVHVPLVRPGADIQVVLRPASGSPIAVRVAPDRRTVELVELIGDRDERTLVGGLFAYRRTSAEWAQTIVRELSRPWLFALALLGLARLLAMRLPAWLLTYPVAYPRAQTIVTAASFGIVGLMLGELVAHFVLDRIPHVQDSVTYLFQAESLALGHFSVPAPPIPEFFAQEFLLVRDDQWFGKYSLGQPLVLALGVLAGVPWLVSPLMAGLAVACTYLAGQRMYGGGVGALAAGLVLSSPFFLMLSGEMMSHPAGLFWASLLLLATVACRRGGSVGWWYAAGLAFGMLFISRQLTAVGVGLAPLLVLAAVGLRTPRRLPLFAVIFLLGALPPMALQAAWNQQFTGSLVGSAYELFWSFDRVGFGPTVGMHGGHDLANGLANTFANMGELLRHLYGWPAYLTLAFAAVPFAFASRRLWDWVLLGSAAGLIGAYIFYWADGIMYGPRYYFEAISALALLSARGCAILATVATRSGHARAATLDATAPDEPSSEMLDQTTGARVMTAGPLVVALLACLLAGNVLGYLPAVVGASRGYNGIDRSRLDTVERANIGSALVFVRQDWPDWQPYGSVFPANGPFLDRAVVYALDLGQAENWRLVAAYPDRTPYLLDGIELTEIRR